jgi:hypothetical protein
VLNLVGLGCFWKRVLHTKNSLRLSRSWVSLRVGEVHRIFKNIYIMVWK